MDIISSIYVFLLFAVVATGHLQAGRLNAHVPPIRSRGSLLLHSLSLRTDPEVLVVFLVGQGLGKTTCNEPIYSPNPPFFHTYKVIQASFEHWHLKTQFSWQCFLSPTETRCPSSCLSGLAVK